MDIEDFFNLEEPLDNMELPERSRYHKIEMNRLFRENVGGKFIPYPEVDNFYERLRSKIIVKFNINTERQTKRKQMKRRQIRRR